LYTNFGHILATSVESAFTNYPNPFAAGREGTTITYYLTQKSTVTLKLFTLWGAPVKTLIDGQTLDAGLHQNIVWDGRNGDGDAVNNGVYYLVLEVNASGGQQTIRRKVGVIR
ncbi:MAG: T9SS type A sorting domain-containing protein, partial [Candidatus Krumholzibacteria bacterium]|nr:T9SS type A sorting domain-containing protein [Candidatus Krumholzibacteria bacterium]